MGQPNRRKHRRSGINWNDKRQCWALDKVWKGRRIRQLTFTNCPDEAERILDVEIEKLRKAMQFGERPDYKFYEGAERYLEERRDLASFDDLKGIVVRLLPRIGNINLREIDNVALEPYIAWRKKEGVKTRRKNRETGEYFFVRRDVKNTSINRDLEVVRGILNSAASKWKCRLTGKLWLDYPAKISMLPTKPRKGTMSAEHSAETYSLSWAEQDRFFPLLSPRLQVMATYNLHTGTREQEVCQLRWAWEHDVPELGVTVFIVPQGYVKNGEARLIVHNRIARAIIEQQRRMWSGKSDFVFPNPEGQAYARMLSSSWRRAWRKAELPDGPWIANGVHVLKHTCGRRLRAAGVPWETRKVCLGHTNGDITSHYSGAEIEELVNAFETLCERREGIVMRPRLQLVNSTGGGKVTTDSPRGMGKTGQAPEADASSA